jgi:rhodanese-related sulfurtransferase
MQKMKQFTPYILLALLSLTLAACGGQSETPIAEIDLAEQTQTVSVAGGSYADVSVEGLTAILENKDFPLINVHIPYEGEIEGTDEFIPFNEIEANLDKLPTDKNARIVLYCRSGSMSAQAAQTLVELGYNDVWNLDGGMIAWKNSGRPLTNR